MADLPGDKTITFSIKREKEQEIFKTLLHVYNAFLEKGYNNALNQIVGYIVSEDPTYITNHKNARSAIRKVDRYELLNIMLQHYLNVNPIA